MRNGCLAIGLLLCAVPEAAAAETRITHGPILGRPSANGIGVWARTSQPGTFRVRYGPLPHKLEMLSEPARTRLEHDNTGWVHIQGLKSSTKYHYQVFVPGGDRPSEQHSGSFRTLPGGNDFRHPKFNPKGLFNFRFEFACGNHQRPLRSGTVELPAYKTMLERLPEQIDFAILNGDWLYEERRDWPPEKWLAQVGRTRDQMPALVRYAPTIVGVWENYRLYLDRAGSLATWHRLVPSFFTFDDHEILDDVHGAGSVGLRNRRAVFRDIGVRAWYDYLGWSNPVELSQPIHFSRANLRARNDVLYDPRTDFTRLDLGAMDNLHVHWGGPTAGMKDKDLDAVGGDPNAGVYEVVEVVDKHRLRIQPPARQDGNSSYSIGRFSYYRMRIANCDFFVLDTRSHRQMPDPDRPGKPGLSMLGRRQKDWLREGMAESDADVFFVVSSVNFMIPHILDVGEPTFSNQDDSWTVFLEEREELIRFWDRLGKPVFVLTGDLHNSFVVKITEGVWEFAAGPHNSGNARAGSEGNRPPTGTFDSRGRSCQIRWSTYFLDDARSRRQPVYCVVQANNVFNNPSRPGENRWVAFPHPQVIFQYYDGLSGELLYAEAIVVGQ